MTLKEKIKATEKAFGLPLIDEKYLVFQKNCMNDKERTCPLVNDKGYHFGWNVCWYKRLSIKSYSGGITYETQTSRGIPPWMLKDLAEIWGGQND